jgi:polyhydroxyalkanoate synthesis repressor PhaR
MSAIRIVKRYANRKLYDTERSCYVTLEDISIMIKEAAEVKVIDNKSGEDLTTVTLAQIIFETEKKKSFMPLTLLRTLIQKSAAPTSEQTQDSLAQLQSAIQAVVPAPKQTVDPVEAKEDTQTDSVVTKPQTMPGLLGSVKTSFEQLQGVLGAKINGENGSTARNASLGRDMEEIRRRLAELGERLGHFNDETV